jgi:hypothetical protein
MLASITPLGERGRHATWWITVGAFLIGSTAAGIAAGAAVGLVGSALVPQALGAHARLAVLAAAGAMALVLDARTARVPGPRRQVDERWLDSYRGWVYGLGYGAQLGLGVTTVVSSAATYLALVAAFLGAGAARGALILGGFGALRGVGLLATARVQRPEQLVALHARLARWRAPAARLALGVLATIVVLAVIGSAT